MLKIMLILILIPVQISEELIAFLFQKILNVYNLQEAQTPRNNSKRI